MAGSTGWVLNRTNAMHDRRHPGGSPKPQPRGCLGQQSYAATMEGEPSPLAAADASLFIRAMRPPKFRYAPGKHVTFKELPRVGCRLQ